MSKIITNTTLLQKNRPIKRGAALSSKKEIIIKKTDNALKGRAKIGLTGIMVLSMLLFASGFYLYQVNSVVTAGLELQDLQGKIQQYQNEGNNLEIKSTELQSTYNLEKSVKSMGLVSPTNVSYIELNGPVAMK